MTTLEGLALLLLGVCFVLIPLGLPGLWGMVLVLAGLAATGEFPWLLWAGLVALAGAAELVEFLVVKRLGRRYGGSSRAFWGAIVGGMAGLFVGLPVPIVGPLLTGLAGTFAGAGAVTLLETRSARDASRVGWGVLLARVLAVGVKAGAGIVFLLAAGVRVLMRGGG